LERAPILLACTPPYSILTSTCEENIQFRSRRFQARPGSRLLATLFPLPSYRL